MRSRIFQFPARRVSRGKPQLAARQVQTPRVPRLAPAARIEDGAIEDDAAGFHRPDDGLAIAPVCVFPEQRFGHRNYPLADRQPPCILA